MVAAETIDRPSTLDALYPRDVVRSRFLVVDGYRTHCLEAGDPARETVILLHGAAGSIGMGAGRFYTVIAQLAKTFHVIAPDEIGHGFTDPPRQMNDLGDTGVRARHALAFIDSLKSGPVHLFGQSQGAMMAAYIALARPDLVKKLVLIDSASASGIEVAELDGNSEMLAYTTNIDEPNSKIPKNNMKTKEGIRSHLSEFVYDKAALTDAFIDHALELSGIWNERYVVKNENIWGAGKLAGMRDRQRMYSYNNKHISESLHEVTKPTLVMWGKQSNKGLQGGIELFKKLSGAQMHILDKANHFCWLDQPRIFNSILTWYLTF
jgi:pimeloyl-ACP methyl ester carboxylesterase